MVNMRFMRLLALLLLASAAAFAQSPQHSIYSEDLDRKADPCTDFYQYANGTWRAQNPIPASMSRWSRRWAAGESNKTQVKGILEEAAARTDWPKGSKEQQIGDYYGSCMNEKQMEKFGITPIKPRLDDIDAMKSPADVEKMIARLHELRI
jgi:endothelin-converting enzyme/putative endopeptidase